MAEAISIQQLKDASLDAKTLEEAVNGDAVTTVLSRLGETYPTLSNALNQIDSKLDSADAQIKQGITDLFENGGLPATPFTTKALMESSELVDGDYAMVTDDTANNGLYVKTAGVWVKSAYDPTALANTYTDNKVKGVTNNFKTKALMVSSELPVDSYAMVTNDGGNNGLYLKETSGWVFSEYQIGLDSDYLRSSDVFVESENLYNSNYYRGFTITSSGIVQYWSASGTDNVFVVFIEIEPQAEYTVTKYDGGVRLHIATLNSLPSKDDISFSEMGIYKYLSDGSDEKTHTFTNTDNAKYLAVNVTTNLTPPNDVKVSVTKTPSKVAYTPYKGAEFNDAVSASIKSEVESAILKRSVNIYPNNPVSKVTILTSTMTVAYFNSLNVKTGFIPIEPNKTYTITLHNGGDHLRVATTNSLPPDDVTQTDIKPLYLAILDKDPSGNTSTTFTNMGGAKYLAVNANSNVGDGVNPDITVVEGFDSPDSFIPYFSSASDNLKLAISNIEGLDLFESAEVSDRVVDRFEKMAFDTSGNLISAASYDETHVVYRVPVSLGDIVYIDRYKDGVKTGNRFAISESYKVNNIVTDEQGVHQNVGSIIDNNYLKTDNSIDNYTYTVTDNRVKEIWIFASIFSIPEFSFEFDTIVMKPKKSNIILADGLTDMASNAYIGSDGTGLSGRDIIYGLQGRVENFLTYENIEDYHSQQYMNSVPLSELYARYDALVDDFPSYVSKEVLWTDEDGNEIRLYKFIPNPIRFTRPQDTYRDKRVLLVSGLHGDEKAAPVGDSHFMESIARGWTDSGVLAYLRHRVEFYVIPVVNTTGYVDNTRFTRGGINIGREFYIDDGKDWLEKAPEAKAVNDVLQARDYDACIDHHTDAMNLADKTSYSWIIAYNPTVIDCYVETMEDLRTHWVQVHGSSERFTSDTELYHVMPGADGSLGKYMAHHHPIGVTLETMNEYYTTTGGLSSGYWTQSITTEVVSNYVYRLIKSVKR